MHRIRISLNLALLIGLIIREVLAPFTAHPFDFEIWIRLGYYVSQGNDPYQFTNPIPQLSIPGTGRLPSIAYPPFWAFIQVAMYKLYTLLDIENRFLYYFMVKQIMVISDIALAILLYKLLKPYGRENAEKASKFWLLCPFTIIISSMWGMFDQLVLLMVIISVFLLQRIIRSSIYEGIGIFLKGIPIIFLPLLSAYGRRYQTAVFYALISTSVTIFFSLSPYLLFPSWNINNLLGSATDTIHKVGNSMNYWIIYYVINNYYALPTSYYTFARIVGYIWIPAVVLGTVHCLKDLRRVKLSLEYLNASLLFITLLFFITRTQINEQYMIYFLGFGIINTFIFDKKQKGLFTNLLLSATLFLIGNNFFLIRFLAPLSPYFTDLEGNLARGPIGDLRMGIMLASGLSFSYFSFRYFRIMYRQITSYKVKV